MTSDIHKGISTTEKDNILVGILDIGKSWYLNNSIVVLFITQSLNN